MLSQHTSSMCPEVPEVGYGVTKLGGFFSGHRRNEVYKKSFFLLHATQGLKRHRPTNGQFRVSLDWCSSFCICFSGPPETADGEWRKFEPDAGEIEKLTVKTDPVEQRGVDSGPGLR